MGSQDKSFVLMHILMIAVSLVVLPSTTMKASSKTIVVPTDYPSIQQAINSAEAGDTVFVKKGLYNETLVVNKTISLIGEDREATIIDAQKAKRQVILVQANNTMVANFTLGNNGFNPPRSSGWYQQNGEGDGIRIYKAPDDWYPQNITIINNTIIGCPFQGINIGLSWYITISGNIIIGPSVGKFPYPFPFAKGNGILVGCLYSVIENNTFVNTYEGISFSTTYLELGDKKFNLKDSNTITGNQNTPLTTIPMPFPSILPSPTKSATATSSEQTNTTKPEGNSGLSPITITAIVVLLVISSISLLLYRRHRKNTSVNSSL